MNLSNLSAEFPRESVHWRVQGQPYKGRDGYAALALAYIDARDVMDRLDNVCGPEGWQDSYEETSTGRTICTLSIKIGDEWISKSDGAGGTQVEAEKGGLSDALKRAAVKWGIGRYLYRLDSPWVACEVKQVGNKVQWRSWAEDPWSKVKVSGYQQEAPKSKQKPEMTPAERRDWVQNNISKAKSIDGLDAWLNRPDIQEAITGLPEPMQNEITTAANAKRNALDPITYGDQAVGAY
ncbi:recombinase [Roseobacter sp. HKCCD9010]|uniref:Rad52/Rad22 family DNA repair protein n=1 Tax=unclassified Roseobacter TaxID=196798 RepID=UPI00149328E9|nr:MULTISPECIES: Rad52/Rad22 family DNA repair protein [unclassified Roseobacter]MBF9050665.1 recombinase [Rhodobacterales bacterium HKCCD4356]NNV11917.1 recombinase [Roseobacter sp. HKCCD7357]NNV16930.1 recombinase [Roseobacter sp. HKCCD8768]NNV26159.1 recombinase [Roseobacter sp. HKCCD8192]NNV30651.1 recombinase [Roseobacter sp. HKCCD9061]